MNIIFDEQNKTACHAEKVFSDMIARVCNEDVNAELRIVPSPNEHYTVKCRNNTVIITASRERCLLYGIYDYFNKAYGVMYYWDGDVYPKQKSGFTEVDIDEAPRFAYRGIRYFAHRSLRRFQAEHFSKDEWVCELDYLVKKRYNFFMLRIGQDDLFQKTFPDKVSYPDENDSADKSQKGFADRTPFWDLKYRGELRKAICDYADLLDLMQPVDCGTMTHWYSQTPLDFIENEKPTYLNQNDSLYGDKASLVWDIREQRNLDNYFALTDTYVREYGQQGLFHTIGLAERSFADNRDDNLKLKKYVYNKISAHISEKYPNSKLLIGSWDFSYNWHANEVATLVSELDENKCIIFDYTSDTTDEADNFLTWGIEKTFPYIFGIFHAYEPNSDIRGDYDRIESRLSRAKADEKCVGFVTWQELSHGDPIMLEYVADNAWKPLQTDYRQWLTGYVKRRFPQGFEDMLPIYDELKKVASTADWGGDKSDRDSNFFRDFSLGNLTDSYNMPPFCDKLGSNRIKAFKRKLDDYDKIIKSSEHIIKALPLLYEKYASDEGRIREFFDIARTVMSRHLHFELIRLYYVCNNEKELIETQCAKVIDMTNAFCLLLSSHADYSLYETLQHDKSIHHVNAYYETTTLKENADNIYCRSFQYEIMRYLTLPELKTLCSLLKEGNGVIDREVQKREFEKIRLEFYGKPISEMKPSLCDNFIKAMSDFENAM